MDGRVVVTDPNNPSAKRLRFVNLALLIGGFGLGQGSIFLAQTLLIATRRMELLASFGTHFSFAMLAIIAVEAGSLTILARHTSQDDTIGPTVWKAWWEVSIFRIAMALLISLAILTFCLSDLPDDFARGFWLAALPAFFLWAFNLAGFLDGLHKSGVSGLTNSLAYMASALTLVLVRQSDAASAGLALGSALSVGYGLTVVSQYLTLARMGFTVMLVRPSFSGIAQTSREELAILAGLLPGQFYFRIQLLLSSLFLGANATALLIYTKQIVGAGSQLTGFVRRTEFPLLLGALKQNKRATPGQLFSLHKASLGFSVLLTLAVLLASLTISAMSSDFTHQAWLLLAFFCITIFSESVGQALVQILFGRGIFVPAALIRILAVMLGAGTAYLFITPIGILVFVLADLCSHMVVIVLTYSYLKRRVEA